MALPVALWATMAGFGLATATVISSVQAHNGTARDGNSKAALAAADAGANIALLRQNKLLNTNQLLPCIGIDALGLLVGLNTASDGWCPPVSGKVGKATYSYRVSPIGLLQGGGLGRIKIVSTGTANGVSRRIAVSANLLDGLSVFGEERVISVDGINIEGDPEILTNVGTNGSVAMQGSASICGNIRHGVGDAVTGGGQCSGYYVSEGDRDLPPLTEGKRQQLALSNSNYRLVRCLLPGIPLGCGRDTYTKSRSSTVPWDAAKRTINIGSNASLTLGGGDYFICQLNFDNGELIMAAGANVRIYFDTPEACGLPPGAAQINMGGNSSIQSTAYNPGTGIFDLPGFYMFGSSSTPTKAILRGTAGTTNELLIYAPNTDVEMHGNASWIGALGSRSLDIYGNPRIESHEGLHLPEIEIPPLWSRDRYVECSGASASPPDGNC